MEMLLLGIAIGVLGTLCVAIVRDYFDLKERVEDLENAVFEAEGTDPNGGEQLPKSESEKVVELKGRKSA